MAHAWLDSLSEDWVSQPASDTSAVQLPPLKSPTGATPNSQERPSRIPRRAHDSKKSWGSVQDSSINVLSERSANDINISRQRISSRPSQDTKSNLNSNRSLSASSNASVVHNTMQRNTSQPGRKQDTPEWKRRLVYGDLQYGEQRDLFCSAAAGLQDMFKPPTQGQDDPDLSQQHNLTMPSSPPMYPQCVTRAELDDGEAELEGIDGLDDDEELYPNDLTPSPSPRRLQREVKYRLNVDDSFASSNINDYSSFQDTPIRQPQVDVHSDESWLGARSEPDANTRKISGQSDMRNEYFSPIMIGRLSDEDGRVDFAPIEVPADQLKQKLEKLRINQMLLDSNADPEDGFDETGAGEPSEIEDTDDYAHNGGFLNLQRGGRSGEGSFRFRGLSPGFGVDTSEMLPEESLQASTPKQFPSVRTVSTNPYQVDYSSQSPSLPRAPFPSPEKRQMKAARATNLAPPGGSPLKLFGPYDSFTNQTLLRRISQYEEEMSADTSRQSQESPTQQDQSLFGFDANTTIASSPHRLPHIELSSPTPSVRSVSQFGVGELEGYQFESEVSKILNARMGPDDKENVSPIQDYSPVAPTFHQADKAFDDESELFVRRRRTRSGASSASKHGRTLSSSSQMKRSINPAKGAPAMSATPKRDVGSEGKRVRTSPSKDPTPKRRRTLHRSDIAFGREMQLAAVGSAHQQMQSAMETIKEAGLGDYQLAHPTVLAMRSILRPRTPTPSQRSSQQREQNPFSELKWEIANARPRTAPVRTVQNMADNSEALSDADRVPSIRTQDFVDQAAQIMAMIRSQVQQPGLSSVEESEAENSIPSPDDLDDEYEDSTTEPLSRPPSREGKPMARMPQRQEDPELIDRLRKYQELSDMGDAMSSARSAGPAVKERPLGTAQRRVSSGTRSDIDYSNDYEVVSDPPNIRLSTNPNFESWSASPSRDFPTQTSTGSTNRTYPTISSRGSECRKTIMPESVSHLIPDRVGSMYLDKQNNVWIKRKEPTVVPSSSSMISSEGSEDDPFASIPDLSVDITREMQNLKLATGQKADLAIDPSDMSPPAGLSKTLKSAASRGYVTLSPDAQLSPNMAPLAREELQKLDGKVTEDFDNQADNVANETTVHEHDISNAPSTARRRNLTISFSSPIASIIQDVVAEDLDVLEDDPSLPREGEDVSSTTPKKSPTSSTTSRSALRNSNSSLLYSNRPTSRHAVGHGPAFIPRPVSRIDEQDEDSTIELTPSREQRQVSIIGETSVISHRTPSGRRASLSFLVNRTPGDRSFGAQGDESAIIGQNVGNLSLSPLSEFTLHKADQSLGFEVSYVMGHRHMTTGDGSKRVMSMTIRELVDKLSEVEPFEPYWEDMMELDLHDKRLSSLHMLDEFCGKLTTLDASQNALGHLEGIPPNVRQLKVSHNMLTELTSWDHLMNLQYVDISGNEVKSLSALKNLVHLRSIKADNNQLTSLDGLDMHDGLLSLKARDNLIDEVDFAGIKLDRLTELDLTGNRIASVRNLDLLSALGRLKLGRNNIMRFSVKASMKGLRQLDLSDNQLTELDISNLPGLQSLHADRNSINHLSGFNRARRLDSLSLREQRGEEPLDLEFLSSAYEVRKLFLSGNYLGAFEPSVDFLNLQLLELANCGLQSLPENLGQLMPNLRTLNINFNAISDVSPLRFIPRMKKLLAAGNRLGDSTSVTELLTDFPHLTQLDLRDNPMTLGFYAPLQLLVPADRTGFVDPFMLPEANLERDETFASRLDEATRLRRRLHQIVFVASCKRLRTLDGLPVRRQTILSKDRLYQMLVTEGLLPEETAVKEVETTKEEPMDEGESKANNTLRSSRWNAEDSFA